MATTICDPNRPNSFSFQPTPSRVMVCTSGSVASAAAKSENATKKIVEIQTNMEAQQATKQGEFKTKIAASLADGKIDDGREIESQYRVLVEYSKEFSLDKIGEGINAALDILAARSASSPSDKADAGTVAPPATTPEAIQSYKGMVTAVMAAGRSSSSVSNSLNFTKTRLAPGLIAFLYAFSSSITDEDTFGSESITASCVMYAFYQSITDLKQEGAFNSAECDFVQLGIAKQAEVNNTKDLARELAAAHGDFTKKKAAIENYKIVAEILKGVSQEAQTSLNGSGWVQPQLPPIALGSAIGAISFMAHGDMSQPSHANPCEKLAHEALAALSVEPVASALATSELAPLRAEFEAKLAGGYFVV